MGAVNNLRNALIDKGVDPNAALRFARIALSADRGASVGRNGRIHFKGQVYKPADFADTPFIDFVTGQKAKLANERAIQADPTYQATMANAILARDQAIAADDAQRRSALINSGYAEFVQGDPILQAAVRNNPFSTAALEKEAYNRAGAHALQDAQQAGTRFGGGYLAAQREALRVHAGNEANSTAQLGDLLSQILLDQTNANQNYATTHANALLQAQQTQTANGTAVQPPKFGRSPFNWFKPPANAGGGGGGGGNGNNGSIPNPPPPPTGAPVRPTRSGAVHTPPPPRPPGSPHGGGRPIPGIGSPKPPPPLLGFRRPRRLPPPPPRRF